MDNIALTRSHILSEVNQIKTRLNYDDMTDEDRIVLLSRGIRSSLRSRKIISPGALYDVNTNCVGALLQLQSTVQKLGIEKKIQPVHVSRLPWQSEDAHYSIHIAGMIETGDEKIFRYIDPTPNAGYLYGQTALVNSNRIQDSVLGGYSVIKPLTPLEYGAIIRSYEFEGGEVSDNEADSTLEDLATIPAYRARLALKLFQKTGIIKYRDIISDVPPEALRGVYRTHIEGEALHRQELFSNHDREIRKKFTRLKFYNHILIRQLCQSRIRLIIQCTVNS
jgi:hypothetical protein